MPLSRIPPNLDRLEIYTNHHWQAVGDTLRRTLTVHCLWKRLKTLQMCLRHAGRWENVVEQSR